MGANALAGLLSTSSPLCSPLLSSRKLQPFIANDVRRCSGIDAQYRRGEPGHRGTWGGGHYFDWVQAAKWRLRLKQYVCPLGATCAPEQSCIHFGNDWEALRLTVSIYTIILKLPKHFPGVHQTWLFSAFGRTTRLRTGIKWAGIWEPETQARSYGVAIGHCG